MYKAKSACEWLQERYSSSGKDSEYMAAFVMPNDRQLALERKSKNADSFTLWLEPFQFDISGVNLIRFYPASMSRHSALNTKRLANLNTGNPVLHVSVDSVLSLESLTKAYGSCAMTDLEVFLNKYANNTLREFVEKLNDVEAQAFMDCYEKMRSALPDADIYTTHRKDGFKDIRIGVRHTNRKKGKPYFMMYKGFGSLFMYEYDNKCHEINEDATLPELDMVNSSSKERQQWINNQGKRYHQHINGNSLNPKDYSVDALETEEQTTEISSDIALNQILFGPPGTGKTYNTAIRALEILKPDCKTLVEQDHDEIRVQYDALVEEGRIGFVTFHQSFSYEDFVEGIRAETDELGKIHYTIQPGVLKQLCMDAGNRVTKRSSLMDGDISKARIWKMSLGNTGTDEGEEIFTECRDNDMILLGYGGHLDFSDCHDYESIKTKYLAEYPDPQTSYGHDVVHRFKHEMQVGDLILASYGNSRFRGIAQVTGEYRKLDDADRAWYWQSRAVRWLTVFDNPRKISDIYKSGFQHSTLCRMKSHKLKQEAFLNMLSEKTEAEAPKPYVLIIDEINRGNISQIFGELITLIEPSKRKGAADSQQVILPYSKKSFSVPENLYIIGTMNTADRSLAQLDIALRRRFEFIEMMPDASLLKDVEIEGIRIDHLLETINERIEVLLDRDHTLGHSYFLPLKKTGANTLEHLGRIFEKQLLPLLQEYFFEDWQRIQWVLNDHQKPEQFQFIQRSGLNNLESLFGPVATEISDRRWRINSHAFSLPDSYRLTIQKQTVEAAVQTVTTEEIL